MRAPPAVGPWGDALAGRDNALNAIRLALAGSVILWHSYVVLGLTSGSPVPSALATWAVNGFFAISGYLICGSRLRLGWAPFLWRRALRIYPAYWVVLILTGAVFAPVATALDGGSSAVGERVGYVVSNATLWIRQYGVGQTLAHVPESGLWNGSLWTLFFEFSAYVAAMVLLGVGVVRRHLVATLFALLAALTLVGLTGVGADVALPLDLLNQGIRLGTCFVAGMLVYALRDLLRPSWGAVTLAGLLVGVGVVVPGLGVLAALPLALTLLLLGALLQTRVGTRNDISYGMYIYAFPVQQLLVVAGGTAWPVWLHAAVTLGATTVLAWLSWTLVESPALRLKEVIR